MNRFIVVDFETTGSSSRQGDSIIQIGAVTIDEGVVTNSYSTYVKPEQPIPPFITSLTGITDEMVADAPTLEDVLPDLLRLLDGRVFVAHNATFDLQFLQEALLSQGYYTFDGPVLDTVELARILLPIQGSYRLVELADDLEIEHGNPHQADSDAMATAQLFIRLLHLLDELPLIVIQRLQMLVASFRSDISLLLRYFELEKLSDSALISDEATPENPDEQIWDIYRQFALRKRPAVAAIAQPYTVASGAIEWSAALASSTQDYQRREAQEAMIDAVYAAMEDEAHLLVEAGTGTGKSLAYLLPSVVWAKRHQEKVVISTHTITLQEQLFQKEIPALQAALPFSFTASQLKGRGNYLCLRKFEASVNEGSAEQSLEMLLAKAQMLVWLTQTTTGDVEELHLPPAGNLLWQQVKSDTSSCLHRKCPWFSRCYYFQAKEQAREADVVVVNHALLFSDLEVGGIIPAYRVGIIDEAHHLEDVATQYMGRQFSTIQLQFLLDRLAPDSSGQLLDPFLGELVVWKPELREQVEQRHSQFTHLYGELRNVTSQWSQLLYHWAVRHATDTTDVGRVSVRYQKQHFTKKDRQIIEAAESVIRLCLNYAQGLEELFELLTAMKDELPFSLSGKQTDLRGLMDELQITVAQVHTLFIEDNPEYVYWLELESRTTRKYVYFYAAPLDVSHNLAERLFAEKTSLTLTSATLTIKASFAYLMERLGMNQLPAERVRTLSLPSPFDYEQQGLMLIPSDFPALSRQSEEAYLQAVIQGCVDVILASQGRTMILFTAYSMLRQVYNGIKELLADQGYTVLGHGIDSANRTKLIRTFKREEKAVLLGTSSFWEGVDIPGDALSSVVIVRLPFTPPNQPVLEARSEQLKSAGKNPFMSLSLPQAVIRFKQGIGRLIRHHRDKGVIVIFDTRIVEARYGRAFLQSLPAFQVETGAWPQLRERIAPFLSTNE